MAVAEKELLMDIAEKYGAELRDHALQLKESGQGLANYAQQTLNTANDQIQLAQPLLQQVSGVILDQSPIPASVATNRGLLETWTWTGISLFALSVGQLTGRYLGGAVFSWWLSGWVSVLTLFVTIPALYLLWDLKTNPEEKERRMKTLYAATAMGLLLGFNLRNYGWWGSLPTAATAFIIAGGVRFVTPLVESQPDRKALLAGTLGLVVVSELVVGVVTGTLTAAWLLWIVAATAILGVGLQLSLWRAKDGSESNKWVDVVVPAATVVALVLLDSLITVALVGPSLEDKAAAAPTN